MKKAAAQSIGPRRLKWVDAVEKPLVNIGES